MRFLNSLAATPRLVLDPGHLHQALAQISAQYPELAAAVLAPEPDLETAVLLSHSAGGRSDVAAGSRVRLPGRRLALTLEDQQCALLHAPFAVDSGFGQLFPTAASLFLRGAASTAGAPLLLLFHVDGIDADFASRHGVALLIDRLRQRFDEFLLHTQISAVTRMLERQIDEVRSVKEKLLPAADHRVHGARYAVHYRPCIGGGGDYYEIADLRAERSSLGIHGSGNFWGAMIGDVAGHGPGAAVEVAMLDSILRTFVPAPDFHTGQLLSYINRHMFTRQIRGGFTTLFVASYDAARESLMYASAGHPAPIVKPVAADSAPFLLDCGTDIPLGVETEHEWQSSRTRFGQGDQLVLYTDGATEARAPDGREFGIAGMQAAVAASSARTADALLADIVRAIEAHTAGRAIIDDCTILVVQPAD